ncbi:MAG: HD domain-containing protein [Puniceicoccales bacterium]|jgi:3'-5' exoribonuclease|nr:HD domain-containing protein [Puniceicoccales bacterium]
MDKFSNTTELKTIPEGQTVIFKSVLILKKIERRNAKNGSEFLKIEVGDKFSSFNFTCFSNSSLFNFFLAATPGDVIFLEGMSRHYQGAFSPDILSARRLSNEEIQNANWRSKLEQTSEEDPQALERELYSYVEMIQYPRLRQTVMDVFQELGESFLVSVAAKSMHHAYKSGLLEHTVHVTRSGVMLLDVYPQIPRDLAIAGMLLHDVGKVEEYEGDFAISRTKLGNLQGHIVLGYRIVRQAGMKCELDPNYLERLEHIILSHQGQLEYGAAILPSTPEAIFVALVDNLDAKMGMVSYLLRSTPETQVFSERFPGLETQMLVESIAVN